MAYSYGFSRACLASTLVFEVGTSSGSRRRFFLKEQAARPTANPRYQVLVVSCCSLRPSRLQRSSSKDVCNMRCIPSLRQIAASMNAEFSVTESVAVRCNCSTGPLELQRGHCSIDKICSWYALAHAAVSVKHSFSSLLSIRHADVLHTTRVSNLSTFWLSARLPALQLGVLPSMVETSASHSGLTV